MNTDKIIAEGLALMQKGVELMPLELLGEWRGVREWIEFCQEEDYYDEKKDQKKNV